ncbi:MAG: hypothetical protein ACRDRL_02915, partial [Sciscionella sp.]
LALPADYAKVGHSLEHSFARAPGRAPVGVQSPGELGTLVFYCHCEILDQFSDPGRALPFLKRQIRRAGPIMRTVYKLNYHNLDRDTKPAPAYFHLVWEPGWVTKRPGVWNVYAPAPGRGHFTLYPINPAIPQPS